MCYNRRINGGCLLMKRNEQKIENTWKTEDIFKDEAAFLACLDTCKELGNELCA